MRTALSAPGVIALLLSTEALTIIGLIFSALALSTGTTSTLRKDAAVLTVRRILSFDSMCIPG
jgi:hypothetical protein